MKKRKVSIKDIAKICDVSTATVSRVINNNGRFSEETRKKVLDAIKETGYQMNYSAKSLRMNKSNSIGILVPDISNYFFSQIVMDIESKLFDYGYSTIIANTSRNLEKEDAYLKMLSSKLVDGLIVISGTETFEFPSIMEKIPYICIDREPANKETAIFIASDHYNGGFIATEQLVYSGAKRPCIITHSRKSSSTLKRIQAFKDALKKHKFDFIDQRVFTISPDRDFDQQMSEFINIYHPDAIFAVNDTLAASILNSIHKLNITIPDEIQLIGYDNSPIGLYTTPSLTSINQNIPEIANTAVSRLLQMIDNNEVSGNEDIILPVELVKRNSTI